MRYLVLLFFAIVMLNEPPASVAGTAQQAVGDQDVGTCCAPATAPSTESVLTPYLQNVDRIAEQTQLPTAIEPISEVSRRVWPISSLSTTTSTNYYIPGTIEPISEVSRRVWPISSLSTTTSTDHYTAQLQQHQEGVRLLCFGKVDSSYLTIDGDHVYPARASREAVPRS